MKQTFQKGDRVLVKGKAPGTITSIDDEYYWVHYDHEIIGTLGCSENGIITTEKLLSKVESK